MTTPPKLSTARAIADVSAGMILATVEIAAPPERVFRALSSDEITQWWGSPDLYRTTEYWADLRVGGSWRASGRGADGKPFSVGGEFLEIDPPRALVQTWKPEWDGGHETTLRYTLAAIPGGTRVTIRHEGFAGRPDSCQGHASGWERVLGWLAGHLRGAAPAPGPARRVFFFRLIGPRPTFPADMTPEESRVMAEHGAYWRELLARGTAVAFGPVAEPTGVWGLALAEVADEAEVEAIRSGDPTIKSGLGFRFEAYPLLRATYRS